MAALPIQTTQSWWPPLTAHRVRVAVTAGVAWGGVMTAGLCGQQFWTSGIICTGDVAFTAGLSIAGGLMTMFPLVILFDDRPSGERGAPSPL